MTTSNYDIRVNPIYQVDFSATFKGKRLAATKRRVKFSFGFSNAEAIAQGQKGMNCRGEEHEVSLTWSLTSGKRVVLADEQEVHFSQGKRTEMRFECSWTMKGNHVVKLVAHAAPTVRNNPGFRQFELFLDGMSFFKMPKMYELGVISGDEILNRGGRNQMAFVAAPADSYGQSYAPDEQSRWDRPAADHQYVYRADHIHTACEIRSPVPPRPEQRRTESMPSDFVSEPIQDHLAVAPVALIDHAAYAALRVDEFAPVVPSTAAYNVVSSQILSAYAAPPAQAALALPALANESHTYQSPLAGSVAAGAQFQYQQSPAESVAAPQFQYQHSPGHTFAAAQYNFGAYLGSPTNTPALSPSGSTDYHPQQQEFFQESPTSVRQLSDLEKAMQSLVNFDDINEPAGSPLKLTMVKEKEENKNVGKSRPLPPAAPAWNIGAQASLADIQANAAPHAAPSSEVMRMHAFDPAAAQAGMLVVYGTSPREAPPLQRGFGYNAYGRAY